MSLYKIYEDDFDQCPFPREESSAVELYWDHPQFPGQWSGRLSASYPYGDWSPPSPLLERGSLGPWTVEAILLEHFGLRKRVRISQVRLYRMSPEELRRLRARLEAR